MSNPYKAPEAHQPENSNLPSQLQHMQSARLKKLYYRSVNLATIAVLLCIGFLAYSFMMFTGRLGYDGMVNIIVFVLLCFNLFAAISLFIRPDWAKVVGIIACALMLLSIPIGTIVGIAGIVAISKAPELFGDKRYLHKDLKTEFKLRKRQKRI